MRGTGNARRALWRWRRNPLLRREDVLEAWILLMTWLVVAVAGPVAGVLGAQASVRDAAQRRAERHAATATLVRDARGSAVTDGTTRDRVDTLVRWTASDGTRHSGRASVDVGLKAGSRVTLWTDRQDHLAAAPPTAAQAGVDAVFTGAASSFAVVAAAAAGYYGARVVLDRRRRAAWENEWQEIGSQWGRAAS
ncbi:hypothetical protein [Streptomyces sp. JHA26]|uniref:Rv1733c family protein n=1 Tax=Streptomyces sp. JHA26 TaxID=1917143 RepID=UPI000989F6ED|nr:hypothetical protein [Streptomyces sp. JHA26]